MRPIAVDLFSGVGGISLGLEQAGFDVACAVEYDAVHAASHLFNFPRCDMIVDSVADITAERVRSRTRVGGSKVSLVVGGPPCQGFSVIGKRAIDDPRNALVREFVRVVAELDTDYFIFENVKGITLGEHAGILDSMVGLFEELGYRIVSPYRVLNAKDFGVPQSRERLIMLGYKAGLRPPTYPAASTAGAGRVTCAEALDGLPDIAMFDGLLESDSVPYAHPRSKSRYAASLRVEDPSDWIFGERRVWDPGMLTSSARTVHVEESIRRFEAAPEGRIEPVSRFFKLPRSGVANTLRAGTDAKRGAFTSPRPIHYDFPRCVTVREMARLHGFPDWFRMHVTKSHGARQVGNAVPPPLSRAVAAQVMAALGAEPHAPGEAVPLGDPSLLSMNVTEACAFFGAEDLVGSRDRGVRHAA